MWSRFTSLSRIRHSWIDSKQWRLRGTEIGGLRKLYLHRSSLWKMQKIRIDVYIAENKNVSTIFIAIFKTNVAKVNLSLANYWGSCLLAVYCHNARKRVSQLAVYCHNARDGLKEITIFLNENMCGCIGKPVGCRWISFHVKCLNEKFFVYDFDYLCKFWKFMKNTLVVQLR